MRPKWEKVISVALIGVRKGESQHQNDDEEIGHLHHGILQTGGQLLQRPVMHSDNWLID